MNAHVIFFCILACGDGCRVCSAQRCLDCKADYYFDETEPTCFCIFTLTCSLFTGTFEMC